MSVNLPGLPALHPVSGIRLGTTVANIRKPNRRDLVVIECAPGTQVAAVFTKNRFLAAPVIVAQEHLTQAVPRALLINTGFANAGTGDPGLADARGCCEALAQQLGCAPREVLPFSTGIIGERLSVERVVSGLPACVSALSENGWIDAASGIMTTDTAPKGSSRRVTIGNKTVTITGIAKGSGMIRPDMATMLAFIATDARIAPSVLQQALTAAVNVSFNRITVDGDTSTNDACMLLASGKGTVIEPGSDGYATFLQALTEICIELAHAIVRDGEGATKFITVEVTGGTTEADCLEVAYTIAHSPLVKTAFSASDPNWGRILAAIGRAPVAQLEVNAVSIHLNDVCVVQRGALVSDYTEAKGLAVMREAEICVRVDLGFGNSAARIWTTDLTHEYVRINAEYRS